MGMVACLLSFGIGAFVVEHSSLNDFGIDLPLLIGPFQNGLFNGSGADECQHQDITQLANTMCSVLCLQIHLQIRMHRQQSHDASHHTAGFQSESKMMTVSAVCRLRPKPPARVDSIKRKYGESGALNASNSRALNAEQSIQTPASRHVLHSQPVVCLCRSIQAHKHEAFAFEEIFDQVQHLCHL